ncbi:MAG: hypothetical protein VKL60_19725 [Sphaerospermopsis sp.]|nr:hypothetical protein [Sphaerospermopsis sp.]
MKLNCCESNEIIKFTRRNFDSIDKIPVYPRLQPNTWVKLLYLPDAFSFDEALLLCQVSQEEWVAWIPDYGEALLNVSQMIAG